jgi:hypothetical protein
MNDQPMKPIILLPEGAISAENIEALRQNGICVVEAKDPGAIKFLDPIPSAADRGKVEQAAIALSRKILNKGFWSNSQTRDEICRWYVEALVKGTPLDPEPTQAEKERQYFSSEKILELQRLAREEAREERAAARAAKKAKPVPPEEKK